MSNYVVANMVLRLEDAFSVNLPIIQNFVSVTDFLAKNGGAKGGQGVVENPWNLAYFVGLRVFFVKIDKDFKK